MSIATNPQPSVTFETAPDRYHHWKLTFDGPIATLGMDVQEDAGLSPDYRLKLNSYDLGVDIELADAVQRIRFEHPEVHTVVISSLKERIFCAGANIFMLRGSTHAWKVNFCKFTNETRLAIEDASAHSGIRFLAALNGICAGGGYELALACDEIMLVDDGNSAVSLPETPLLGVLPGTGGLTRVVDKRKVRRDLADFFGTVAEGIKGKRAVEWRLVDAVYPTSQFKQRVAARAQELAQTSDRPAAGPGIVLGPLNPAVNEDSLRYSSVSVDIDRAKRVATMTVRGPEGTDPSTPDDIVAAGDRYWPLRAFRELDDALLRLRANEPLVGTILVTTEGDPAAVLAVDETLAAHQDHWLVREIVHFVKRTLKRMDLTSRSFFALIEPGSCFAGTLFELALAADRSYMLDDPDEPNTIGLSAMNAGPLQMSNGLTRLQTRFLGEPARVAEVLQHTASFDARQAHDVGLVSFAPDELDWDDEVRLAVESRSAFSPDALTGMEANLRFAGPETMETKIFGRLTAWQNWIFQRPNAVGEKGALTAYGSQSRPEFDFNRV
ncbi:MAG: benzoyl-CoA-dihydrodiol lyase [Acidobacteria bacterium RIFCSPLOWO2_02_FULL_67_36]|nr:MAG: benzoyl-CoA-dihydrodiol lyase [Acidobacteria bacterium RIFCSPLOWO2_02_FULL_67_36]OFW21304.1 MAG: benzoyl-CoA-dihydrodiol lyase [Acidobacteria bacterium RIFCSPLOWO2_12_FULL_66_21]